MRVFVTGASGFLGRAFVEEAGARGWDVLCLSRTGSADAGRPVAVARGDLASVPWADVERFAPDALLHLAWIATPGEYLESPVNATLVETSIALMEGLAARGVRHLAAVGSCIEYAPSSTPLVEDVSPTLGDSPYAAAKCRLHEWLAGRSPAPGSGWSWLRVFYPYGPGEHPGRITTGFLRALAAGGPVALRTPDSVKDFVFVTDLARALCAVLEARLQGPVNIGTGTGTSIRAVAETCARVLGLPGDRVRRADALAEDPRPFVVADTTRLRSTGWRPEVGLEEGVTRLARALGLR
jgi:dTDP-6-deoxy-L-talose 4-dehydrogenase (NAD+)